MVSTKITSSSVAEIDNKLKTFNSPMVKIEYLENCLKQMLPNDASRYCHLQLADLYAQRLMYGPASRHMDNAADTAVTFKDKTVYYLKEINFLLKMNDFLMIDKAYKKAMLCSNNNAEKDSLKTFLKREMMVLAEEYEKKNKRSSAILIYERLISMPITNEAEKKELMAKVASLSSKMGRIKEAVRYEQMMQHPIEKRKSNDPDDEARKVSLNDLGLEMV
jgi:tetratricopeptide (TPR) repeat protein